MESGTEHSTPTWADLLGALVARRDLTPAQTHWAMAEVMQGQASPEQLAGFLIGLRAKGETVDEVDALVGAMLEHAVRIEVPGRSLDLVGTGGDRQNTVNISTMAAIVVAGSGRRIVKHGNRAASSASGTADVLEELGVRLDLPPQKVAAMAHEVGITFCFAQAFHPSMRHAGPVRRALGIPTVFNFLGPLANPAQPSAMALGVFDSAMAPTMAGVLARRGADALVFRGDDGLDELSTSAPSQVWVVGGGAVHHMRVDAEDLGLQRAPLQALVGAGAAYNAQVVRDLLDGARGPVRDAVLLNAAAGIVAFDGLSDLPDGDAAISTDIHERLAAALKQAEASVDSGSASAVLQRWVKASGAA